MNRTGKRCIMQFDKVNPATCKCVSYCPQATPPKTEGDRIRSMSDGELTNFFDDIETKAYMSEYRGVLGWLEWLKQESENLNDKVD